MVFDAPTTIGVYIGEGDDEQLLRNFDDHFAARRGAEYKRSETIKEAMHLYLGVDQALADLDFDIRSTHDRRMYVRQAIYDKARRERDSQ